MSSVDWLDTLPKAELHLHLEGSLEPETVCEIDPAVSLDEARAAYRYADFAGFIQSYIWVNRKLTGPREYGIAARRLFERLRSQNVQYAEINVSAGVVLWKEQDFDPLFAAVREEAEKARPLEVRWIFDAVRQFGPEAGERVLELALRHRSAGVVGFGIGGDEQRGSARWFSEVFREARAKGLWVLPHAGESAGPDSIWAALESGARRIGHGIRAVDDPQLMAYLRDRDIPLEVCVSSNVATRVIASLEEHPLRCLYDAGVPVVLNTDDPAMFHTTLSGEYRLAMDRFGFTRDDIESVAANAFRYAAGYVQGDR